MFSFEVNPPYTDHLTRPMTITDPAHVAAAKVLREQYQRPARSAPDPEAGLVRDLADYDRAFGLTDGQVA